MKWQTSAPANLMIMGEHAVVYGHKAIACAINQRLTIDWVARDDRKIFIFSELANFETSLEQIKSHPKLNWITTVLQHYQQDLPTGLEIHISSQFKSTLGLGSSAALLAALLGGLDYFCEKSPTPIERFQTGLSIIQQIQGRGSGTDLAASLTGGMILFDPSQPEITKLEKSLYACLVYCGYKTPTASVLETVAQNWQVQAELLVQLYQLMGQTTQQAFKALEADNLSNFFQLVNSYQGLMDALGVNDQTLSEIVYAFRQTEQIPASKISGSGLGDCVLALSQAPIQSPDALDSYLSIPIEISSQGLLLST